MISTVLKSLTLLISFSPHEIFLSSLFPEIFFFCLERGKTKVKVFLSYFEKSIKFSFFSKLEPSFEGDFKEQFTGRVCRQMSE